MLRAWDVKRVRAMNQVFLIDVTVFHVLLCFFVRLELFCRRVRLSHLQNSLKRSSGLYSLTF